MIDYYPWSSNSQSILCGGQLAISVSSHQSRSLPDLVSTVLCEPLINLDSAVVRKSDSPELRSSHQHQVSIRTGAVESGDTRIKQKMARRSVLISSAQQDISDLGLIRPQQSRQSWLQSNCVRMSGASASSERPHSAPFSHQNQRLHVVVISKHERRVLCVGLE